jgi:hypothetical protein
MTAQERADWEDARMAWGAFPPEPFRFAGRSFTGSAVLGPAPRLRSRPPA